MSETTHNNNTSDNNCNTNNRLTKTPKPCRVQRYEFPVLAEDLESVSRSWSDPLACNVNNDAVLIWNDVIIRRNDDEFPLGTCPDVSIEDVFQELRSTVETHQVKVGRLNGTNIDCVDSLKPGGDRNHHDPGGVVRHEAPVVSRRRMYESGLDPMVEGSTGLNNVATNSNSNCLDVVDNELYLSGLNSNQIKLENDEDSERKQEVNTQDSISHNVEVDKQDSNLYVVNQTSYDLCTDNDEMMNLANLEDGYRIFPHLDSSRKDEDSIDKSIYDSGHFEDMSTELSPTSCNVYSQHCSKHDIDNECDEVDGGIDRSIMNNDDKGDDDDNRQHDSLIDMDTMLSHRTVSESCDADYDSEVFVEDERDDNMGAEEKESAVVVKPSVGRRRRHRLLKDSGRSKQHNESVQGSAWLDDRSIMVRCANQPCGNATNLSEARKSYKNCHHCLRTYYCCRDCRREDWGRHKSQGNCHGSLVSSTCKKVIRYCNSNPEVKAVLSRLAIRGYLSHGRGCVMMGFPDIESTEEFMGYGFSMLELNPIYVSAKELSESKMYGSVLEKLLDTCNSYKPDFKFVLNVGVGLRFNKDDFLSFSWQHHNHQYCYRNQNHEEIDRFGSLGSDLGYGSLSSSHLFNTSPKSTLSSPKSRYSHCFVFDNSTQRSPSSRHKAPIIQKFIKLKLNPPRPKQEHEERLTFEDHYWDEFRTSGPTLILTGIPKGGEGDERKERELTFINIQRKLRQRNVNLCQQYPSVHAHLIAYVTRGVHFPSQVLFPVDTKTGRTFTCFMMPEAEAELEWMQSHHLLNDLDLSRGSLNKSMSRSLSSLNRSTSKSISSSVPSLSNLSPKHIHYSHHAPKMTFGTPISSHGIKTKSKSLDQINSKMNFENGKQKTNLSKEILRQNDAKDERKVLSELTLCDNKSSIGFEGKEMSVDSGPKIRKSLREDGNDNEVWPSVIIKVEPPSPESLSVENISHQDLIQTNDQCYENNAVRIEPAPDFRNEVIPSYYPVRKARNVKLHSHTGKDASIHAGGKPRSLASASTTSPPAVVISALSPEFSTSTPITKSFKPPDFDIASPIEPPRPHNDHQTWRVDNTHRNKTCVESEIRNKECVHKHAKKTTNDSGVHENNENREYGFDSCYRNNVVVDEVDQMKRRRKDRKSMTARNYSPNQELQYYWFEDTDLDSPPLATSTLVRNDGPRNDVPYRKQPAKRKKKRDCRVKEADSDATDTSGFGIQIDDNKRVMDESLAYDNNKNNPIVNGNGDEINIEHRNNKNNHNNSKRIPRSKDKNSERDNLFTNMIFENNFDINGSLSASFRRKFNTNSPHFPKESSRLPSHFNSSNDDKGTKNNDITTYTTECEPTLANTNHRQLSNDYNSIGFNTSSTPPNHPISSSLTPCIEHNTRNAINPKKSPSPHHQHFASKHSLSSSNCNGLHHEHHHHHHSQQPHHHITSKQSPSSSNSNFNCNNHHHLNQQPCHHHKHHHLRKCVNDISPSNHHHQHIKSPHSTNDTTTPKSKRKIKFDLSHLNSNCIANNNVTAHYEDSDQVNNDNNNDSMPGNDSCRSTKLRARPSVQNNSSCHQSNISLKKNNPHTIGKKSLIISHMNISYSSDW